MISNIKTLPAGLRRILLDTDWLTEDELKAILQIVAESIHKSGTSKAKLSRLAGISPATVARLMSGKSVGCRSVRAIAKALDAESRNEIGLILDDIGTTYELIEYGGRRWKLELIDA